MKFGLYLTVLLAGMLFGSGMAASGWLALVLLVATPVLLWWLMLRYHRSLGPETGFGMLWLDGTLTVMFGLLIAAAFLIVYMKWIEPDFVLRQLQAIIDANAEHPEMGLEQYATVASNLIANGEVPSPALMASTFIVLNMMVGVVASAVFALGITVWARIAGRNFPQQN